MFNHKAFRTFLAAGFIAAGLSACGTMSSSNMVTTRSPMSASQEVPANSSRGSGTIETSFDKSTNVLKWKLSYSGLTGPAAAAHFHGPAAMGANAGVALPFPNPISSGMEGQATLTPAQAADFLAGKWYANIHTADNKGGEIRGQVTPGM